MTVQRLLPLVVALVLGLTPSHAQQRPAASDSNESRIALVIGNAGYANAPLKNPLNDARAMARTLNELGFEVTMRSNLSQRGMVEALREFGAKLKEGGVALFFYSGHGMQVKGRNFLIPVDADIRGEDEVPYMALDVSQVLDKIEAARTRTNIVVLDACRNNPYVRAFRSSRAGLAQMDAPAGTLIAFSTAPGSEARDGNEEYGVYTKHLLTHVPSPGLPVEIMFRRVREGVVAETKNRQTPWESSSLTGDFYFNRAPTIVASPPPAAGLTAVDVDKAVQAALRKREEEETARRAAQQSDIERAVMAALRKREQEQAAAQATKSEQDSQAAKASIERLNKELTELRAAREAEKAQAERVAAAPQQPAPPARPAAPTTAVTQQPDSPARPFSPSAAEPKPAATLPVQLALAEPSSRAKPVFNVGGRVERPDVRVGDTWKYQITDGWTNLKSTVAMEVATVTGNRIYTRSAQTSRDALDLSAASGAVDVWDRDWNQLRQGETEYTPFYPSLQFPLENGKRWEGTVTFGGAGGSKVTHQVTAQVVGWERVTVPAGTFDAIKITLRGHFQAGDSRGGGGGGGVINDVVWYAPVVQQFVKKDFQQHAFNLEAVFARGGAGAFNQRVERWELVEYKPN